MVVSSRLLRGLVAFAISAIIGVATTFLFGVLLPIGIVRILYGLGPGAGDAWFIWMMIALPVAGISSLLLASWLTTVFYRKLTARPAVG
jgi:hypothetical protein